MVVVIESFALVMYALASLLLARRFISVSNASMQFVDKLAHSAVPLIFAVTAITLHGFLLISLFTQGHAPNLSMVNVASLLSWLMVITLLVSTIFMRTLALVSVSFAFAAVGVLLMLINPNSYTLTDYQASPMILHIILLIHFFK